MTRKKLMYIVLAAVGLAYFVDRVFLREPEPASAKDAPPPAVVKRSAPAPKPSAKKQDEAPSDPALAYLSRLKEAFAARDVFAPTGEMVLYYEKMGKKKNTLTGGDVEEEDVVKGFREKHVLQATFMSPSATFAAINGELVRVGQTIDGFRLTRVTPYSAEFHQDEHELTLQLPVVRGLERKSRPRATRPAG